MTPAKMALYLSIVHFPWSFKILFGIITDNVPIVGKYRKPYLIIMGLLQFMALVFVFIDRVNMSPFFFTASLAIANYAEAVGNVVTDALICERVNKIEDKDSMSNSYVSARDIFTLAQFAQALGAIIGGLIGTLIAQSG